jgi:hypothetical protein
VGLEGIGYLFSVVSGGGTPHGVPLKPSGFQSRFVIWNSILSKLLQGSRSGSSTPGLATIMLACSPLGSDVFCVRRGPVLSVHPDTLKL